MIPAGIDLRHERGRGPVSREAGGSFCVCLYRARRLSRSTRIFLPAPYLRRRKYHSRLKRSILHSTAVCALRDVYMVMRDTNVSAGYMCMREKASETASGCILGIAPLGLAKESHLIDAQSVACEHKGSGVTRKTSFTLASFRAPPTRCCSACSSFALARSDLINFARRLRRIRAKPRKGEGKRKEQKWHGR